MGFDLIRAAQRAEVKGSNRAAQKSVLVALAIAAKERMKGSGVFSAYPGQDELATRTSMAVSTVRLALHGLESAGLISIERRYAGFHERQSDLYTLHLAPSVGGSAAPSVGGSLSPESDRATAGMRTSYRRSSAHREEAKNSQEQPARDGFDLFWEVYTKHIGEADARDAWRDALKIAPAEYIVRAAKSYIADNDPQYYKKPAAWLESSGWRSAAIGWEKDDLRRAKAYGCIDDADTEMTPEISECLERKRRARQAAELAEAGAA